MNRAARIASTALVHLLGVIAFAYPFLTGSVPAASESASHAGDAPYFFVVFAALLVAVAASEIRSGRMDTREIALLGVLAGINAILRVPGSLGGGSLMFFLPIMCGAVFGARFGFLLGATSMAVSGVITGGAGPWLPFQMWALGWVGAGAALARPVVRRHGWTARALAVLAAYAWVAGMAFGALANLWFWPYLRGASDVAWSPAAGAGANLVRYGRFYVLTSLAWDSGRALVNVALVAALGRPAGVMLSRFRRRLGVRWEAAPEPAAAPRATMGA